MSKGGKAAKATRQIRWVEGHRDEKQPVFWGQMKKVELGDREIPVPTDRRSNFIIPADPKVKGSKPKAKHSKAQQAKLQAAANEVLDLIDEVADGTVTSFFYSAEANSLRYSQTHEIDGQEVTETRTTEDETLLEAAQDFADLVADTVASRGKPLEVAEGPEPTAVADEE